MGTVNETVRRNTAEDFELFPGMEFEPEDISDVIFGRAREVLFSEEQMVREVVTHGDDSRAVIFVRVVSGDTIQIDGIPIADPGVAIIDSAPDQDRDDVVYAIADRGQVVEWIGA